MDNRKGKIETMERIVKSPRYVRWLIEVTFWREMNPDSQYSIPNPVFLPQLVEAKEFKLNLKPSNPIRNPNQIKDFLKGIGGNQNQRTAKILESPLNKNISLSEEEWIKIVKNESRENLSHSILLNSLRMGIPKKIRPRIWAFIINAEKYKVEFVTTDNAASYDLREVLAARRRLHTKGRRSGGQRSVEDSHRDQDQDR
jgi:hypothetical protein